MELCAQHIQYSASSVLYINTLRLCVVCLKVPSNMSCVLTPIQMHTLAYPNRHTCMYTHPHTHRHMHTHPHTHRHMHTHPHTHTQTYVHTSTHTHRHMHTHPHTHRHMHTHECTRTLHAHILPSSIQCVFTCACADTNTHTHTHHTHTHPHIHHYTHIHTHAHTIHTYTTHATCRYCKSSTLILPNCSLIPFPDHPRMIVLETSPRPGMWMWPYNWVMVWVWPYTCERGVGVAFGL